MQQRIEPNTDPSASARREFLAKCGRLAVVTPPAVTLMLAASQRNFAVAQSGGPQSRRGNDDGVPRRSMHDDINR